MNVHYREEIFKTIDSTFDCDWYINKNIEYGNRKNVKSFDTRILRNVTEAKNSTFIKLPYYWEKGMIHNLFNKKYDTYLIDGYVNCASLWIFLFLSKFFPKKKVNLWSLAWTGKENWLERKLKKLYFGLADVTFVYSDKARNLMIREGIEAKKLFAIHNSLAYSKQIEQRNTISPSDIYKRHFNNNDKTIILIGRLVERKRLDIILRAMHLLKGKGESFNVVFIGNGEMKPKLEKLCKDLELTSNVWFYGACYDEKTNAELIYNADICISPIVGLTAIHAMMFGTPVITRSNNYYNGPEAETVKDGVTGMFIEHMHDYDLTNAISQWFQIHENDRETIRKNCYKEIDLNWNPQFQIEVLKSHICWGDSGN
ncbi:MAG: glycosyltransferase [Prevotella sp.]|nr:glycosyltransferase [Prevotella sp.]